MQPARGLDRPSPFYHLFVRIVRPDDWNTQVRCGDDGLFCAMHNGIAVGSKVVLEVVAVPGPHFFLGGTVAGRRIARDLRMRPGVTIRVDPGSLDTLRFIDDWASGVRPERRACWRLPARLAVTYRAGDRPRLNFTRNISEDGVFIYASKILAPGEWIAFRLLSPGADQALHLKGQVIHQAGGIGMGIQLQFAEDPQRARYLALLHDLQRACLVEL